jgi:hypothetical protein
MLDRDKRKPTVLRNPALDKSPITKRIRRRESAVTPKIAPSASGGDVARAIGSTGGSREQVLRRALKPLGLAFAERGVLREVADVTEPHRMAAVDADT